MRFNTFRVPYFLVKRRHRDSPRQSAAPVTVAVIAAIAALALSACSRGTATATAPANFAGGAFADEPQAAHIVHIILENGGSSADAACSQQNNRYANDNADRGTGSA